MMQNSQDINMSSSDQQFTRYVYNLQVYNQTQENSQSSTIQRPLYQTHRNSQSSTIQRPLYQTHERSQSSTIQRPLYQTHERSQSSTIQKPLYQTHERSQSSTIQRPLYQTHERSQSSIIDSNPHFNKYELKYSLVSYSPTDLDNLVRKFYSITNKTGAILRYVINENEETLFIYGTIHQIIAAKNKIKCIILNFDYKDNQNCSICDKDPKKDKKPFGLLKNCNHIFCYSCIMRWRKESKNQRSDEARLGCPVCRICSYQVFPYHEAIFDNERLAVIANKEYICKQTPCKWSTRGIPCIPGKHCIYDHSSAPQVIPKPNIIDWSELVDDSSDNDFTSFLLEGGIYVYSDSEADDLDFSDRELAEAIINLRLQRRRTNRER